MQYLDKEAGRIQHWIGELLGLRAGAIVSSVPF
jgi:hypothetical protein